MWPLPPSPEPPSLREKLLSIRLIAPVLATVVLVAGFAGALLMVRAGAHTPTLGSGPAATATTAMTTETTTATTTTSTPALTPGATPTANSGPLTGDIRVTQNQDMRPVCLDGTAPYTVVLFNAGTVTATWQVVFPEVTTGGSPYWGGASPNSGTLAPGQSASFVISVYYGMPCSGTMYHASVHLSFPSGASQPDIPLTYAGTGPAPYSNVVLVAGSLTNTQPCPPSGSAPPPFTFAIQNTGNAFAVPSIYFRDTIGPNYWADDSVTFNPPNPAVSTWLYAGETWTITVSPHAGVLCNGTVYHVYIDIHNAQGTMTTMTITDTFQ